MMKLLSYFVGDRSVRRTSQSNKSLRKSRRSIFESLETRDLLTTIGLGSLADVTLAAGSTMYIPLQGTDVGKTITYSVSSADYSKLTTVMMPSSNKSVQMNVTINGVSQPMTFQLFDNLAPLTATHIENLVSAGFYNGLQIYRNGKDGSAANNPFVIQGGNEPPTGEIKTPTSAAGSIAEEFNPNLQYTSFGALAMARTGTPNTSSTEFYITEGNYRFLDYNYTMFGYQTTGKSVVNTIAAMPNSTTNSSLGYLQTPLTITSASLFTDTQNGVLQITAPVGTTTSTPITVTVTASDGTNTPTVQTFHVTIASDATVNPTSSSPANPWAAYVPVAPTSVAFVPSGSGASTTVTSLNNSDSNNKLNFLVSGVTSGNKVEVLADGNVIGTATAAGSTVTVTTNGSMALSNGAHSITAIQILPSKAVTVSESGATNGVSSTADVPGYNTPAVQLTVATGLQITSTPASTATVGQTYTYTVATSVPSGDSIASISATTKPTGMTDDGNGHFTWTPTTAQKNTTQTFTIQVTDTAGTTKTQTVSISVQAFNLQITSTAPTTARVGNVFTYALTTNVTGGITIASYSVTTEPTGMTDDGHGTYSWTPTSSQKGTQTFTFNVTDSAGNTASQPVTVTVYDTLTPVVIPTNTTSGGNVTVSFSGGQITVLNNLNNTTLSTQQYQSTDTVQITCPDGQTNIVNIVLPTTTGGTMPALLLIQGGSNPTSNQVVAQGPAGGTTFALNGTAFAAQGLNVTMNATQKLTFSGSTGNDVYQLNSAQVPVTLSDSGGTNTLDFSGVSGTSGVTIDLSKIDGTTAQPIAPWGSGKTLTLNGTMATFVGTSHGDTIVGGAAPVTTIRAGNGNNTITGGSSSTSATIIHTGNGTNKVTGGSGNTVVVGGSGTNTVTGGSGTNLLIGGTGTSTLNAKGTDNLLIGGSTNLDSNDQALLSVVNSGAPLQLFAGWSFRRTLASSARFKTALATSIKVTSSGAKSVLNGNGLTTWFVPGANGKYTR